MLGNYYRFNIAECYSRARGSFSSTTVDASAIIAIGAVVHNISLYAIDDTGEFSWPTSFLPLHLPLQWSAPHGWRPQRVLPTDLVFQVSPRQSRCLCPCLEKCQICREQTIRLATSPCTDSLGQRDNPIEDILLEWAHSNLKQRNQCQSHLGSRTAALH
jgi:hypothetical protein